MKKNNKLIIFSGLDGSGKSTQINLLKTHIKDSNRKYKVFWARIGYTKRMEFLKLFIRKILKNKIPSSGKSEKRNQLFHNNFFFFIWINIAFLDLIILWGIIQRYYLLLNYVVICDRYIVDTEIDLKLNFPNFNYKKNFLWNILLCLIPKKSKGFFLWIDPSISKLRSKLKKEPFPDDIETLKSRLNLYNNHYLIKTRRYHAIECTKSINLVSDDIKSILDS